MRSRIAAVLAVVLVAASLPVVVGTLVPQPAGAVTTAAPSAGCGTSAVGAGNETLPLVSSGVDRTFVRHVPPAHDGTTPVPLVVAIHGLAEGSILHQQTTEYGPLADAEGFVVAFPQGLGSPAAWNASLGSNDLAFIGALLDHLEETLCVDTNRIYVSGYSMGAFMTSSVACVYADRVAAVAPVAGVRNPAGCEPDRPTPLLTFHGTNDTWVSYTPIPGIVAAWSARNGCGTPPSETFVASDEVVDITLVSHPCDDAPVDFYSIEGGGHGWPGSEFSRAIEAAVGYTTFEIHATELIWEFFQAHPMPAAATGTIEGRVVDAGNEPLPDSQVEAYTDDDGWIGTAVTTTAADGTYSLEVPPGEYRVVFRSPSGAGWVSEWWEHSAKRSTAQHVSVEAGQARRGVDGKLSPGGRLEGTVTGPDGAGVGGVQVWVYADTDRWVGTAATVTASDGTYTLGGVPAGLYRVLFRMVDRLGLASQWWDGVPLRRDAPHVHVEANRGTGGVDAELAPAP